MFAEMLDRAPLRAAELRPEAVAFPKAGDPAWERIPEGFRQEIAEMDRAYAARAYPMRTATEFLAFSRSGSRRADEEPYFFRRRKLCVSAAACCAGINRLDQVMDGIWCICEETSWVISAHNINPVPGAPTAAEVPLPDADAPVIDLFAAQTGMILALTASLLGAELDAETPMLRQRIRREIRRRVIRPFLERDDFWWMGVTRQDLNNWTPWITANVLYCACLLQLPAEELIRVTGKALVILDRYLAVIPPDGGCDEGPGYWNMAGGSLEDCLEILEQLTGGVYTFWEEPKIRNILAFPLKAAIGNGWFANFADCDARPFLSGERLQTAGEKTGNPALAALGREMRGSLQDQIADTPHLNRMLQTLFHPAAEAAAPAAAEDTWLPDLQWRIVRRGGWTLCCKGGHNGENHNHNDVGSFMLYVDGEPVIVDAGNMVYTAKTFSEERYTLWNVRGAYHNVPLIGGEEQAAGAAFAAAGTECLPDGMTLDIAGAYPESAGAARCVRTFQLAEGRLTVRDEAELKDGGARKPAGVSWVLMLRNRPAVRDGRTVESGPVSFAVPEGFRMETEEIPVEDARMARSFPGSLWRMVITAPAAANVRWTLEVVSAGRKAEKGEDGLAEPV